MVWCYKISGVEKGVVGGKNGVLLAQSPPLFSLKRIKIWGVRGGYLIIIYIYNNFIWVGEGYSFSM